MVFRTPADVDEYVLDDVIDAYVDWREQSQRVWLAYHRWSDAAPEDWVLALGAYIAELDQEQRTCDVYAATIAKTAGRLRAHRENQGATATT